MSIWSPTSWREKPILQQPNYPNQDKLNAVLKELESYPPLVFAGEAKRLKEQLADVSNGEAFLLQGGDCAESFSEFHANNMKPKNFKIIVGPIKIWTKRIRHINSSWANFKKTDGVRTNTTIFIYHLNPKFAFFQNSIT